MIEVRGLMIEELDKGWEISRPFLRPAAAFAGDEGLLEKWDAESRTTHAQLFLILDGEPVGAMLTRVVDLPSKRAIDVVALGGVGFRNWGGYLDEVLRDVAHQWGATVLMATGRLGWAKELKKLGWKQAQVTMKKELK